MRRYSHSRVSTYLRCPRLFRLRYVEEIPPEEMSLALPFGSAFHDAIAWEVGRRALGETPDLAAITTRFHEMFEARVEIAGCLVTGKLAEVPELASRMFEAYVDEGRLQSIEAAEVHHIAPIGGGLEFEGYADFVAKNDEGHEIVELKTSARLYTQHQVDLSLQAAGYALTTGIPRVRFVVVTKTKEPKVQTIVTEVSKDRIECLKDTVLEVDRAVSAGAFPRNPTPQTCGGCEYRRRCLGLSTSSTDGA